MWGWTCLLLKGIVIRGSTHNNAQIKSSASFKLLTLCVRHPSRIPSLLECYSTRHSRDLMFSQLWTVVSWHWVCFSDYSTVSMRSLILYFCSCERRWCSTECVLLPCFNALPDIFAVMNCSVLALSAVFCSCLVTWSAVNLCSLQWHIVQWARGV